MSLYYSPMYNLGILPESSAVLRTKQGLRPQKIASDCTDAPCACSSSNMYPVPSLYPNYGAGTPSSSCPCLQYSTPV